MNFFNQIKNKSSRIITNAALEARIRTKNLITPSKRAISSIKLKRVLYFFIGLILLYLILALVGIKSAYNFENSESTYIERIVPYPAAIVGGKIITISRIKNDVNIVKYFIDYTKTSDRYEKINIADSLFNRLIDQTIIENLAQEYNIKITDQEVENAWQAILTEEDGFGDVDALLKEFHNTSEKHFKIFIRETLLREKVAQSLPKMRRVRHILISYDKSNANEKNKAFTKIHKIRQHIITGTKFEDIAKNDSMDLNSRDKGGDIGWIDYDFMLDGKKEIAFRDAIFKTKLKSVSEAVSTHLGYHLIKPIEEKGKIKKSMGIILQDKRKNTKIIRFLKFDKK